MTKRALNFTFSDRHINLAEILVITFKEIDPDMDIYATYIMSEKDNAYVPPEFLPKINLDIHIETDNVTTYHKDILQSNGTADRNPFHNTWLTKIPQAAFTSRKLLYKRTHDLLQSYDQIINTSCDRFILNFENIREILNTAPPGTVTALFEDVHDPRDFIPDMLFHTVDVNTIPMMDVYKKILCTGFEIYTNDKTVEFRKVMDMVKQLENIEPADWVWEQYHLIKSLNISLLECANCIDYDLFKKTFFTNLSFTNPVKHGEGSAEDHSVAHGTGVEWSGMFEIADETNVWSMQKVNGKYADPAMRIVIVKIDSTTQEVLQQNKDIAQNLIINGDAIDLNAGETLTLNDKVTCLNLIVDDSIETSLFTIKSSGKEKYAIYTQHVPYEFEHDQHFFKTTTSVDIEPILESGDATHHHDDVRKSYELSNIELIDRILDHLKIKESKFQVFHEMSDDEIQEVVNGVEQLKSLIKTQIDKT